MRKLNAFSALVTGLMLVSLTGCDGQKWSEQQVDSFMLVTQKGGPTLGYSPQSGVKLLTVDGFAFKDLNRNDSLDAYEDWRLPAQERAADLALVGKYFDVVEQPEQADFAICLIQEPSTGIGYSAADVKRGGNGYLPFSLQYDDYTARDARAVSIAGGDPMEKTTNRSFRGKTVKAYNRDDMVMVQQTKKAMGDRPVIVIIETGRPVVLSEIEPSADAILISFKVQHQALLDIISGQSEPSALLPMQMPADMKTVEEQQEDVPRDLRCYQDADGHTYDFAFGLNWTGIIDDARVKKYK